MKGNKRLWFSVLVAYMVLLVLIVAPPNWLHPEGDGDILPEGMTNITLNQLSARLEADDISEREYRYGYNCIDFAWDTYRELCWQGVNSGIVGVRFEDGTSHAMIIVPTSDKGWVLIDPQNDSVVKAGIGDKYQGKRIVDFKVLVLHWQRIEDFKDMPAFEVVDE